MTLQPETCTELNFDLGIAKEQILQGKQRFVGDILTKRSRFTPERIALQWQGRQWTFGELNNEVNQLVDSLFKIGVQRGERLALIAQNRGEHAHFYYAASKSGIILAPINWRNVGRDLIEALDVITPETVCISAEFLENLCEVLDSLPYVKRIILLDDVEAPQTGRELHYYSHLLAAGSANEPRVSRNEEDAFYVIYTSGTTGIQKAAIISQRSSAQRVIANLASFPALIGVNGDDSCVCRGPFFHTTSPDEMFATHALGGKAIVMAGWNVEEMVDVLETENIGWLSLSPGMYIKLIDAIKRRNAKIKSVRAVGSMPELTPKEELKELSTILNAPILNTFGSTEAGFLPFTQNTIPVGHAEYRGKAEAIFCSDVRFVDDDGNEVPDGEPGELICRSTMMFSGYWNNPEENARVFKDGWFFSGDVLKRNPDGTMSYVSRKKYMIKSGAENVYPAEIERVLFAHPQVREACVVGAKHLKWGETPIAFIAVSDPSADPEEIKEYCKQNMARYRVPNVIEIVPYEDFPRNTTGKVLREKVEPWIERILDKIV